MKTPFFTVIIIFLSGLCFAQSNFDNAVADFLNQPDYKNATVGIHVVDLESGGTLFALNENQLMVPASTLKLATSAAALELLGPNYRFETKIGYTGTIAEGALNGDLVVIGGGDPTLGSEYFEDHYFNPHFLDVWVQKIKEAGIDRVNGNLVLDISIYDSERNPPTWVWEDLGNYYGAGPSALSVYDNTFGITFRSPKIAGKQTKIIAVQPEIEGLKLNNEVIAADIRWDQAYAFGGPLDKNRILRGAIPKNKRSFTIKAAIPQPEQLLAKEFLERLAVDGVQVSGEIKINNTRTRNFQQVFVQFSPGLDEIVEVLNHESVNLIAEHLVKQIAAEIKGYGSRSEGLKLVKGFWDMCGIPAENWFMEDGSGLSHFNAVSPKNIAQILEYMFKKSSSRSTFLNSLASIGEGTLVYWDQNKFPGNSILAKSGSMTRVRCYAGYLYLDSGKQVAFSIMANHFGGSHSKIIGEIENLLFSVKQNF